jgi:hypothetical protein
MRADPRDLARRVVALAVATTVIVAIVAGRPLLAALERASAVCVGGTALILVVEAIVRRVRRREVR